MRRPGGRSRSTTLRRNSPSRAKLPRESCGPRFERVISADASTSLVEASAEMTLSNRGPQDSRGNFARDGEFRRKVVDLERPPGRRICGGVGQREVSCAQPSGVCKKVQAWDQEDECAQGGGGDADDLLQDGAGGGEDHTSELQSQ